jgi:hypothetical protein
MKKPLLDEFERWIIVNASDTLYAFQLESYISKKRIERAIKNTLPKTLAGRIIQKFIKLLNRFFA